MPSHDKTRSGPDSSHLLVFGMNHVSAPIEVREEMAFTDLQTSEALGALRQDGATADCVLLSTCNRTEVYCSSSDPERACASIAQTLDGVRGTNIMRRSEWTYSLFDGEAVEHIFRVACGLGSLMVGEDQIFSQIKRAYDLAVDADQPGLIINKLFQAALHVGKRARAETEIGLGAVGVWRPEFP